ncbi:protein Hol1p [[Candida] railenensis]|uniref:Protein Hol1p n=1 Tax=[Candida] railenensis TaxID=45579 RepID=A0A9P0QKV5_9ASCO|nr:protein Hol1p [[Candida] railenensis]
MARKHYEDEDFIPGTVNIFASKYDNEDGTPNKQADLKKDKNGVILLPQPSSSPNDPLNWSSLRKGWHLILVCFITALTAATSNDAASASDAMNEIYGITYDAFNTGAGILFIFIGWSCIFFAPASSLYGRRITYMICLLSGCLGCMWFGLTKKTSDSLFSQIFVGLSESCTEAQVQQSISDVFFQHQLGSTLTLYILSISIGSFLGPLIANYIGEGQGFRWIGYWGAIICGGTLVVVFFGCEETVFDRTKYIPIIDSAVSNSSDDQIDTNVQDKKENADEEISDEKIGSETVTTDKIKHVNSPRLMTMTSENPETAAQELGYNAEDEKWSYWKRIAVITPSSYLKGTGFLQYIYRFVIYFKVFTIPAVWFSGILWGLQDAYMSFFLTTQDDYFTEDPWNYTENGVAIMNVPTLIGAVIGCIMSGIISDYHILWLAKRNNSIYEPEMRLWLLIVTMIISPLGLIMFGVGAARQWPWQAIYVGLGFIGFGWGSIGDTAMSYLMDSYPEIVIQGMVGVSIINNTLACIFTFTCSQWLESSGTQNTYIALAVIDIVTIGMVFPMFWYGKKFRKMTKGLYINLVELSQGN